MPDQTQSKDWEAFSLDRAVRPDPGYLIYHPMLGVYLGHDGKSHYWSVKRPGSLMVAVVFAELDDLRQFVSQWEIIDALIIVRIRPDIWVGDCLYASMRACIDAGVAGGWLGPATPCWGPIQ